MESGTAEKNILPCTNSISNEKDHSRNDKVVCTTSKYIQGGRSTILLTIPAKVPIEIPGPNSTDHEKEGDHREDADDGKDLGLPVVDHVDYGSKLWTIRIPIG